MNVLNALNVRICNFAHGKCASYMMTEEAGMEALTPVKVVELLDRYIVGQQEAKRAVAVALRMLV